jgi:hypothetical protein
MQVRDVQLPSYVGRFSQVTLLALAMIVFLAQPSWAGSTWEKACEKDLTKVVENQARLYAGVLKYNVFKDHPLIRRAAIPRTLGAEHALCIDRLITATEQVDWQHMAKFKQGFTAELLWVRDLLKGDLKELYRQAKYYQTFNEYDSAVLLSIFLRRWARYQKFPKAIYDQIQEGFLENAPLSRGAMLKRLAAQNYLPALIDAARRFLLGDGVPFDRGEAYYWLKRAEFAHGNVTSLMVDPRERLLEEMNDLERHSLIWNILQFGDLDWSRIDLPPTLHRHQAPHPHDPPSLNSLPHIEHDAH